MDNAPKKNVSPLLVGKYGKSTKKSTCRRHRVNEGKIGWMAKMVSELGELRSLRSKKKLAAENRQEMHFWRNQAKEKLIKDFVERETTVARKQVKDAGPAIMQDMTTAQNGGVTPRKVETTFDEMMNAIGPSLSNLASSDAEQDGEAEEDDEEDTELGKPSDDDEPS
jgi:hypothetical protein